MKAWEDRQVNGLDKMDIVEHEIVPDLIKQLKSAMAKHAPMNSSDEAYAVILEEVDEYWNEVKKQKQEQSDENMKKELLHIAAMALRAIIDVHNKRK